MKKMRHIVLVCLAVIMATCALSAFAYEDEHRELQPVVTDANPLISVNESINQNVSSGMNTDERTQGLVSDSDPIPCEDDDFDYTVFEGLIPDILYEDLSSSRGGSVPTSSSSLPYTADSSGGINEFVYTNYYFTGYTGYRTSFTGSVSSGTMTFDLIMHNKTMGTSTSYRYNGSSWGSNGLNWNDRNSSHQYYYEVRIISKTVAGATLSFTMGISSI